MRCLACDKILTAAEDARKYKGSGQRVGLCTDDATWVPKELLHGSDEDVEEVDDTTVPLEEEELDEDEDGNVGPAD